MLNVKQVGCWFILVVLLSAACNPSAPESTTTPVVITTSPTRIPIATSANIRSVTVIPPSGQQYSSIPVVFLLTSSKGSLGDIYTWDLSERSFKQLTTWGYNFAPHYSPNGKQLVYRSVSQAALTALQSGAAANTQFYTTIWLLDPVTGDATRIADQPQGATVASGNLITRSTDPVWSPDGAAVAWTEADTHGERLVIYAVASQTTSTFPLNLPAVCCEGAGRTLYWGQAGLAILSSEGTPAQTRQVVYVFSAQGQQLAQKELSADFFLEYGWITKDNHAYLGGSMNGLLTLVDPFSADKPLLAQGYVELYSPNAPNELAVHAQGNAGTWTITRQDQSLIDIEGIHKMSDISVAPDGVSVVFERGSALPQSKVFAYSVNRETVPIIPSARVVDVTWGLTAWRIHP